MTKPKKAIVYIEERIRHAVEIDIEPEWLDEDGDLTREADDEIRGLALDQRGDSTVQACTDVDVVEVELE
jgi:hypothetical protein